MLLWSRVEWSVKVEEIAEELFFLGGTWSGIYTRFPLLPFFFGIVPGFVLLAHSLGIQIEPLQKSKPGPRFLRM